MYKFNKVKAYLKHYGLVDLIHKYRERREDPPYDFLETSQHRLQRQRESQFDGPKISIIIPAFNPGTEPFKKTLESVKKQTYDNWELCISDCSDEPLSPVIKEVFGKDSRIVYRHFDEKLGISDNSNMAAAISTGEYIAIFDHDDLLTPDALFEMAHAAKNHPGLIYSDEDKISEDYRTYYKPYNKPDFNLPLLMSNNYICHLAMVRKNLFDRLEGFRREFDGAQDYDLFLRIMSLERNIVHVPKILYHWRAGKNSTSSNPFNKDYASQAALSALVSCISDNGLKAEVKCLSDPGYFSIIPNVPSKNYEFEFLSKNRTIDEKTFSKMCGVAEFFEADIVIPKIIEKGKYIYNGVAIGIESDSKVLRGKKAWYRGKFNLARTTMRVGKCPNSDILIRKDRLEDYNRGKFDKLYMIYYPEIEVDIGKK